jgi:pyridoxine/pyridoxamine 5'-phosphate oxidase
MRQADISIARQYPQNEQTVVVEETFVDPDPMTQLSSWLEVARGAGEPMPEAMAVATATPGAARPQGWCSSEVSITEASFSIPTRRAARVRS